MFLPTLRPRGPSTLRWLVAAALSSAASLDGVSAAASSTNPRRTPPSAQPMSSVAASVSAHAVAPTAAAGAAHGCLLAVRALLGGSVADTATAPPPAAADAAAGADVAPVDIRTAVSADLRSMKRINEAVLPENYPLSFYEHHMSEWPGIQLVACAPDDEGKVVGYCLAKMEGAGRGHVLSIAVLPSHRNRGTATAIMAQVTGEMRRRYGASCVTLNVRKSNEAAIHVYTSKLGYRLQQTFARYYQNGEDALHLVLRLDDGESLAEDLLARLRVPGAGSAGNGK
mmetsp:Transcript_6866/g.18598  ORF Transcript_6866/g.18598 Transcript_6866/m.18598 type:complete len:284 (+) Transcript_6866:226-1077(+)